MGKASGKKKQHESQAGSILNSKPLISSDISSKWSLFNKPIVHFFLIAVFGLLTYSNTFTVPFQFDDIDNVIENYRLRDLNNFWPPSGSRWFGFLTFALNYHFGGLNTIGYHIVNLVIHIFNAILVYWLVVITFKTPFFSNQQSEGTNFDSLIHLFTYSPLFIALLFVSHPIQTQAVTYIVQRFTSLATMLYLLSLVLYIKWREEQKAESRLYATRYTLYTASIISAILAMKTKEISFTLPLITIVYEFMFFEGNIKKRLLFLIPIILTMLIIPLGLTGTDSPIGDAIGELREASQETEQISRWDYLPTQFRVIVTYIRLLVLPINQNLDYDYTIYHSFFNPEVFLSLLFLLLIFAFGIYLLYANRYTLYASRFLAFGIFWFFITLSVESSIIPIKDVIFEHRVYLPGIGIIIAFTSAGFYGLHFIIRRLYSANCLPPLRESERTELKTRDYLSRISLITAYLLLSAVVIVFAISTYQRNIVWKDEVSLWEDAATKSPEKARVYYNLGKIYSAKGWGDKAIENYQTALKINPDFIEAHNNLGVEYKEKGWVDKAIEHYQIAIWLGPDFSTAHNNMGNAYIAKGWLDKAIEHYRLALRLKPDFMEAHNNLGVAYEKKGLLEEAINEYQTALLINPELKMASDNLNKLLRIKEK
ncbi:MAG: hypothetical protein FD156_1350 [Nitrospirae bacterium]|nr:MAG: hypothetical protein FD156_1350 [Nitrospirota bacterium]